MAVDCALFGVAGKLRVLLVPGPRGGRRLPGTVPEPAEDLDAAARRALTEQTGIAGRVYLEQLYTFGRPDRTPGVRQVSVAYLGLVDLTDLELAGAVEARGATWEAVDGLRGLAFDHDAILAAAVGRLRGKLRYTPLAFELLPELFSLSDLQRIFEAVLGQPQDKRNFRRKALASGLLVDAGERQHGVAHRAARLFRFDRQAYLRTARAVRGINL